VGDQEKRRGLKGGESLCAPQAGGHRKTWERRESLHLVVKDLGKKGG